MGDAALGAVAERRHRGTAGQGAEKPVYGSQWTLSSGSQRLSEMQAHICKLALEE